MNQPVRVNNFWRNNYIEYKSNGRKSKIPSVEEYLDKIRPCLRDIVNDLKHSGTWKIQLTITINFISSKDDNDEEQAMHSKSDNMEIMLVIKQMKLWKNVLIYLKIDIKIIYN